MSETFSNDPEQTPVPSLPKTDIYDGEAPIISADGIKHNFPAGTSMAAIDKAMKSYAEEHRDKTTTLQQVGRGIADPAYGLGQLLDHIFPPPPLESMTGEKIDPLKESDKIVREREAAIQKERGFSKKPDWARMAGQALSPINYIGAGVGGAAIRPI